MYSFVHKLRNAVCAYAPEDFKSSSSLSAVLAQIYGEFTPRSQSRALHWVMLVRQCPLWFTPSYN